MFLVCPWQRTTEKGRVDMLRRWRLVIFYALAYAISWPPGFVYASLTAHGSSSSPLIPVVLLAASYGPTLAALLTLALLHDPTETRAFRRHLLTWRAGIGWYVLALLLPAALWAIGALLSDAFSGESMVFTPIAAAAFPALLLANAGEEIGWRGFAFPQLLVPFRPLTASLIFGVLWAGIHLPLYVMALDRFAIVLLLFAGLSVLMAWIYLRTGEGVLIMIVFHSSLDTMQFVLPLGSSAHGTQTFAAIALTCVVAAALVLWRTGPNLGRPNAKEIATQG
jgi:membrane protease YdiL (CAAX protease family)